MALAQLNQNGQQQIPRRDSAADESPSGAEERVMLEGQKAYIIINAIGAIVLLVFLQAIWSNPGALLLKKGVLWGIVAFGAGVAIATLGYALRLWSLRRSGPRIHCAAGEPGERSNPAAGGWKLSGRRDPAGERWFRLLATVASRSDRAGEGQSQGRRQGRQQKAVITASGQPRPRESC